MRAMSDGNASEKQPLRLVVIGDSTSFTDDRGPQLPGAPHTYPNVIKLALQEALEREVSLTVLARSGTDTREVWGWLYKDRHVQFDVMAGADAVVLGIGSFDHAPAGFPPLFEAMVPYLRPAWVRRRARKTLYAAHPIIARATGARFARTPLSEFERLYDAVLFQTRALTQGAAGVVMGPISHGPSTNYYGRGHPGRAERERIQFQMAQGHGFGTVASWPFIQQALDRMNPDGIHWPADVHAAVGQALGASLIAQLLGEAPRPKPPSWG